MLAGGGGCCLCWWCCRRCCRRRRRRRVFFFFFFFLLLLLLLLVVGCCGGGGVVVVVVAAAVAVVYALVIELFVHRELKWEKLPKVLADSGVMMGTLFLIIVLAIAFNKFLAEQYIPQNAAAWMQAHVSSKWQFLILVNIFLLGLGCVMEIISAILIVAPLLAP
mgnify:CR=1 FL=1